MPGPASDEYLRRRHSWSAELERLSRQDARIAYARLAVFAAAAIILILAIRGTISGWWLLLPLGAFIPLLKKHERIIGARDGAGVLVGFYERAIARIDDRWIGTGETGERFLEDDHLYAADLDLFGRGSLFELLSLARTRTGEETIAAWLKQPASSTTIALRHEALRELTPRLELRESLMLAGVGIRAGFHPEHLIGWAEASGATVLRTPRAVVLALTVALPALLIAAWLTGSLAPFLVAAALRALYEQLEGRHLEPLLQRGDAASRELAVLVPALLLLERDTFSSAALRELHTSLRASDTAASVAIRRLRQLVEMHDWNHNIFFTPIAAVLMWNSHVAHALEHWRSTYGRHVRTWLRSVGELEALASLAAYSYEHPNDPLPDVFEPLSSSEDAATFDGEALGHPLLPQAQSVRNDVRLGGTTRLLVISGSNMSGKSTLLRTVGINAVLALAGAPVRARSLRMSPLAIGATLRIQDSLQQGKSRFLAEITRIRQIADCASARPLLFLLDELFHGTNSHDRLVGATGVLQSLIDRGAIGLITTHDLALTAMTRDLGARAVNVHFEDSFDGTDMRFDYRMKDGPVTRSNAIALMRAVGLDVREDAR